LALGCAVVFSCCIFLLLFITQTQAKPGEDVDGRLSNQRYADTLDLRHFGPKTFRHWCRNVQ